MAESTRRALATSLEVADYLGVPKRTLDQWAYWGIGPKYARIGKYRRYRWEDVDAYVTGQVRDAA